MVGEDAAMNRQLEHCQWCGETGLDEPPPKGLIPFLTMHPECMFRSIMGSVTHIEQRCSCFVPGADETDPPGMSRREAARAALAAWKAQGHEFPRE